MSDPFRTQLVELLPRLRRFALGLTGNPDTADDLVQAGCEKALARRDQWQPGTRLDSWMYKIMQNHWIDQVRARHDSTFAEPEEVEQVPDRDIAGNTLASIELSQVMAAMQALPPPMRAVLALVCIEDLSYKEAAESLGVPIGTVMSRLARARVELQKALAAGKAVTQGARHAPLH